METKKGFPRNGNYGETTAVTFLVVSTRFPFLENRFFHPVKLIDHQYLNRTTNSGIDTVADQNHEIWNCPIFVIWIIRNWKVQTVNIYQTFIVNNYFAWTTGVYNCSISWYSYKLAFLHTYYRQYFCCPVPQLLRSYVRKWRKFTIDPKDIALPSPLLVFLGIFKSKFRSIQSKSLKYIYRNVSILETKSF